jgi:Tfp pilus assembly protein PilZ
MGKERRQSRRVFHEFDTRYRYHGDLTQSWSTARTLDLSATGLRFKSEVPMEHGAALELSLQLPGSQEPLVIRGRVMWIKPMANGQTEVGVQFMDLTPTQEAHIDELVGFLTRGDPPE